MKWASGAVLVTSMVPLNGCKRHEWHASPSGSFSSVSVPPSKTEAPIDLASAAVTTSNTALAFSAGKAAPPSIAKYSVQFTDIYYVHPYILPRSLAIAITTVSPGPVRILLATRDRCFELPRTADQLPHPGTVDLNKDQKIFGWIKPPCCGDVSGRLGKESLLHIVGNESRESFKAVFDKRGYDRPFVSTAEIFSFRDGSWQRSPLGRKRFQSIESVYTINEDFWFTESISNHWSVLQVRNDAVISKVSTPSLPNDVEKTVIERKGLDFTIFPDMSAISWGYLDDGRLLLDRWDNVKMGSGTTRIAGGIALTIDQMNDLRNERVRNDTFTPWLQFEFRSASDVVIARYAQKRTRVTYNAASRSWTTAEEPGLTTQEKVAELLHLIVEPRERTDSVKVLGSRWVAVRRKDAEHVIEVFTNDDSLARCGTITEGPYVYEPSGSNREHPDAGQ